MNILVTGGAGFVGSHLVDSLLAAGHSVRVLDNLDPQVHGALRRPPPWFNAKAELSIGDVRDIRHCFADTSRVERELGYRSEVSLEDGMRELLDWLRTQEATDSVESAAAELERRGLTR